MPRGLQIHSGCGESRMKRKLQLSSYVSGCIRHVAALSNHYIIHYEDTPGECTQVSYKSATSLVLVLLIQATRSLRHGGSIPDRDLLSTERKLSL